MFILVVILGSSLNKFAFVRPIFFFFYRTRLSSFYLTNWGQTLETAWVIDRFYFFDKASSMVLIKQLASPCLSPCLGRTCLFWIVVWNSGFWIHILKEFQRKAHKLEPELHDQSKEIYEINILSRDPR